MEPPHAAWTTMAFSKCGVGEYVVGVDTAVFGHDEGTGGSDGHIEPCWCAAGRECGVGDGESECFGDDL